MAYEVLLPISLVTTYGLAPALWGAIVIVNPALVVLVQLRLIRWTAGVPAALKLGVAMPLMGVPFLLLPVSAAVPVVVLIVAVFVLGEMLWVPTSQAAVAAFAPADIRGAYMWARRSRSRPPTRAARDGARRRTRPRSGSAHPDPWRARARTRGRARAAGSG